MIWPLMRIAAQLRRIAKALEESNRLRSPVVPIRKPRPAVFGQATVESLNEGWYDRNPGA